MQYICFEMSVIYKDQENSLSKRSYGGNIKYDINLI